jgi:Fe-S-cluster-containing dehydrogenase component
MSLSRRTFFKVTAVAATTAAGVTPAQARTAAAPSADARGVLVDLTKCIGCRQCEAACAEANKLPDPDWSDDGSYAKPRTTTDRQWTAVNLRKTSRGDVYVKSQCMHCLTPACATGCLTRALDKRPNGAVVWDADKCMGCRYCMVACPFDVPKFEYNSWNPKIQKCRLCVDRLEAGKKPACVENCGGDALTFGTRSELLEIGRKRIYDNPGKYVSEIYGEHEVGGTSWLYLSPVPFAELGFRTLSATAVPETTRNFLTAVPIVLVAWPAFLLGLRRATDPAATAPAALTAPTEPALAGK